MRKIVIVILLLLPLCLLARKEVNIWYFGTRAGLDFNSGKPIVLTDGMLDSDEGCAVLSDRYGKLLFYTDGVRVWNKEHKIMPNGTGLLGHNSSTQSSVIVPIPESDNLFYIFTVDDKDRAGGFRFSMVDMKLDSGLGDVVDSIKNLLLFAPSAEKICALNNEDCSGVWVMSHEWNSNAFRVYLVSATGIDTVPVISKVGIKYEGTVHNKKGYLKAYSTGSRLAAASGYTSTFEVFDFDNSSGTITHPITLSSTDWEAYGVEFSPDGSKLYATANNRSTWWWDENELWQYDLNAGTQQQINNSRTTIGTQDISNQFGALQMGPDGKIYVAREGSGSIGVINKPNARGIACNYVSDGVNLGGRTCVWGLPFFIQSYFYNRSFISLPSIREKVDTRNVKIPLTANLNCGNTDSLNTGFEATIEFDARLFYLREVEGCDVLSKNISGTGKMTLVISKDSVILTSIPKQIAVLVGDILIGGDTDSTLLDITSFKWIGNTIELDTLDGEVRIYGLCQSDLRKIQKTGTESLEVLPNPAYDKIEISVKTASYGNYQLVIYDVSGNELWIETWFFDSATQKELKFYPDISGIPAGVYVVNYTTPIKVFTKKLIIIK